MKKIKIIDFVEVLKKSLFDYCLLLSILENNENIDKIECYLSQNSNEDFMCYIKYSDGSETLDINWNQNETHEILSKISKMKKNGYFANGCFIALYKTDALLTTLSKLFFVNNVEYITSYYSKCENKELLIKDNIQYSEECLVHQLDEDFIKQEGNHIKIIENELKQDPQNNKIIYMIMAKRVIGYIALKKQYENIWDVAYIFVDKNFRKQGYGTLLCEKAISFMGENKGCLYYSYCENASSEAVAKKAKLCPCAERYVFSINFAGLGE